MNVFAEKFDDIKIFRFEVPGFEKLSLKKKLFIYYLGQATIAGRDILWDQHGKYNLYLRDVLEAIYLSNPQKEGEEWESFEVYLKKVWFSSGPHHHYSTEKFTPEFSRKSFKEWLNNLEEGVNKIKKEHLSPGNISILEKMIFDPKFHSKRVNTNPAEDMISTSANNFYEDVTQGETESFYKELRSKADNKKLSFGLNSRLTKVNGTIKEEVYCIKGKYGSAIEKIHAYLKQAAVYVENNEQQIVLNLLIEFYETGDLELFDQYCIKWVETLGGDIDYINGFIETYGDPLGIKATWEGVVQFIDIEETKKAEVIAEYAGWFEQNAPVNPTYKKDEIKGISLKAINAVVLGGDCYPASPLGINLPNAEWIREQHGSKSVTLTNISNSHHKASLSTGFTEEFTLNSEEVRLEKEYGAISDNLHTHLHECVGHGSGKMMEGVTSESLKSYGSVIEETRADLYGLYYMYDPKMTELGLLPNMDAAKAHYNGYIRNGLLTQITRIKLGSDVEQAHMRNRQLIARWVYEKGEDQVIKKVVENGKSYFVINDYEKLRILFGDLLNEIQRIKSEGDYEAAKQIVESYGVKIDQDLHREVLERFEKLKVPPFTGFLNPNYTLVNRDGEIEDVIVDYETNYSDQMLYYSKEYGFLKPAF
ncbi:dihydrofolate reductase [Labilibacter sediminis]|nr:dihydrofolate reductase [Labilibacter sediminis]